MSAGDGSVRRQQDATLACQPQRLRELRIAETTEVGALQGVLRNDEHVPEATPGLDEEHLGSLVDGEEVAVVTVPELPLEEFAGPLQILGGGPYPGVLHRLRF
jgi:hypothetical protein